MATSRRTRGSCNGTSSPQDTSRSNTIANQSGSKRRCLFSTNDDSPAKRPCTRASDDDDDSLENSPVNVKSFYGGGKGRYLSPLDRKLLKDIRKRNIFDNGTNGADSPQIEVKSPSSVTSKPIRRSRSTPLAKMKSALRGSSKRNGLLGNKPSCQEIMHGSPRLSVKNNVPKEETRIYSPSRKGRRFFKSRRVLSNSGQSSACVQRNNLQINYQPTSLAAKQKENMNMKCKRPKTKLLMKSKSLGKLPRTPSKVVISADSPSKNTRSSPWKTKKVNTASSSARIIIASSKNPNSQNLFSPSDWDFEDVNDTSPIDTKTTIDSNISTLNEFTVLNESGDSEHTSRESFPSNASIAGDSVGVLSDLSEDKSSPACLVDDNKIPEVSPVPAVFAIFNQKRSGRSSPRSGNSMPNSGKQGLLLRNSPRLRNSQNLLTNSPKLLSLMDKYGKEQLTLDFGQKLKGAVQCPTCGMTYNHGQPSDEALHNKFHERLLNVLKFPGWKNEHVLQEFIGGSRIIVVMPDEKQAIKKVLAVKKIVDEDLGFVVNSQSCAKNSKTFMYISEDKRIVGFCIAEPISSAYRVLANKVHDDVGSRQENTSTKPWCCGTSPVKARCGINRIWVLGSERLQGTASKLLDCVSGNFLLGFPLRREDLAFTDPTPDGRAFAMKYTGTPSFLVYKHSTALI